MTIRAHIYSLFLLIASITLLACGGGGGTASSGSVDNQGQFIDSVVSGLRYESTSNSGITNAQGQFNYRKGELLRFFVGDVFIGETLGQAIITPVDLVAGAVDETNIQVQNIAIFLQSIDDDGDESNGINITSITSDAALGQSVDFTLASGVFETDGAIQTLISNLTSANGSARSMLPRAQARDALGANLITFFTGNYQGTFAGSDTGSWTATISSNGTITGSRISDTLGTATISGSVASSGQSSMSGTADTVVFSGSFNRNGSVNGSWRDNAGESGTFSGNRISSAPGNGGTTPPGNNFGSLTISGSDAAAIGASYVPNLPPAVQKDTLFNTGTVNITWFQSILSSTVFESRSLIFIFNENSGSLSGFEYLRATSAGVNTAPTSFYTYSLDCGNTPQACMSISLDIAQQQVTFNNTSLAGDIADSNATGAVILNGSLSW